MMINRRGFIAGSAGAYLLSGRSARAAGDTIKIGVLNDQSGVFSEVSGVGSVVAAHLAAEDFGFTLLGRTIELVDADHKNNVDLASSIARRWIEQDGVDVIADGASTATGFAILEVTRKQGRIFLVSGPASPAFSGTKCSPLSFHFNYDTYALSKLACRAIVERKGKSWFFIRADNAFGEALQRDAAAFVTEAGGTMLGSVAQPSLTADFTPALLLAQSSGADVVGLATAGKDLRTAVRQAAELDIVGGGQQLAGLLVFITDVAALGLAAAQGLQITTSFYWDKDDRTRAWTKRFHAASGRVPTMINAGVYSGVMHYLQAIQAAGTTDPATVAAKMHEMPVNDMYNDKIIIRPDGRVLHEMFLAKIKSPAASRYENDFYEILRRVPGAEAFRPLGQGECPMVAKS
jgi:branched-chain amino acid transport system substrate-binding protein